VTTTIGKRIRAVRRAHNETQLDLACRLGISRAAISQWESDETKPSSDKLAELIKHYDLQYDWLLFGKGRPPSLSKFGNMRRRLPTTEKTHERKTIVDFIIGVTCGIKEKSKNVSFEMIYTDGSRCYSKVKPELARVLAETILSWLSQVPS
jgi:transcriptional regulator with XRE-family HTH domain